jgi:hypothetical protein
MGEHTCWLGYHQRMNKRSTARSTANSRHGTGERSERGSRQRQAIAVAAARLIAEHGITDYRQAKRRAARSLGLSESGELPSNSELEAELRLWQTLYQNDEQRDRLADLRRDALEVMELLDSFSPALTGPAWNGTATRGAGIMIDLFTDAQKSVEMRLVDLGLAVRHGEAAHFKHGAETRVPTFTVHTESGTDVRLALYPASDRRGAFLHAADEAAPRGEAPAVRALLEEDTSSAQFLATLR